MAVSTITANLQLTQWNRDYFKEYMRNARFAAHTGQSPNNVFQVVMDLSKKEGDNVRLALVVRLTGAGVTGDNTLEGNEEALGNYSDSITVDQVRNAVVRGEHEQSKSFLDILEAGRYQLKEWSKALLRDLQIARLIAPTADGVTTYAAAAEADKDTHLVANSDRYLFGSVLSNYSGDHDVDLAKCDTTNDTLDRGIISLAKRIALSADPHITPIQVQGNREFFIAYCGTNPHRDLKADMDTLHSNAGPRSIKDNPIFRDDDLVYEDVIVRQIPEMASLGNVGFGAAPAYQVSFCGAQAVGIAWAKKPKAIRNNGPYGTDYGNMHGAGIAETRGAKKLIFNAKQHGMVTVYVAAAADA